MNWIKSKERMKMFQAGKVSIEGERKIEGI